MNFQLMEQIIRHVYNNLGVVPSEQVNTNLSDQLRSEQFLLPETLTFEAMEGEPEITNSVWGCQITLQNKTMKIILGDCTQDPRVPEFCAIYQLQDVPAYGTYLVYNDLVEGCLPDPLIAVSTNKNWMVCDTYLQATFLAGMEQIRNMGFGWSKCTDYKDQFDLLNLFIKYHGVFYGAI